MNSQLEGRKEIIPEPEVSGFWPRSCMRPALGKAQKNGSVASRTVSEEAQRLHFSYCSSLFS